MSKAISDTVIPGPMTKEELISFLGGNSICRVSCIDDQGWPHTVPVWYQYKDKGFYLVGREKSNWAIFLSINPNAYICIDTLPEVQKVLVKGTAEIIESPNVGGKWVQIARDMATRYLGKDGPKYLEPTMNEPRWLIFVKPIKIQTWQGNYSKLQ